MSEVNENQLIAISTRDEYSLDVARVLAQTTAIQRCMESVMKDGEHYGVIPGTTKPGEKPKKTLLQPGADKLCLMFRLRPEYEIISKTETDMFIAREVRCRLYHIPTGELWGEGIGSVNSREARYMNQATAKVCPKCGKPAIIRGKEEYGGGWICFTKKDGCGAKFKIDDKAITDQSGHIEASKLWDLHNTLCKMANKRARVAAVLTATAASDIFTQDLEDLVETEENMVTKPATKPAAKPRATVDTSTPPANDAPPIDAEWSQSSEPKASAEAVRALSIAMTKLGIKDREDVLQWCAERIGHPLATRKDLTVSECKRLIDEAKTPAPEPREPGEDA